MNNITISEGHSRGFASNLIFLLGALYRYPEVNIVLLPPFLSLYASDSAMGNKEFFEETSRSKIYDRSIHGPITLEQLIDFGGVFPFPSYNEHKESGEMKSMEVTFDLSALFANHIKIKNQFVHS